jgi:hypothetical protein
MLRIRGQRPQDVKAELASTGHWSFLIEPERLIPVGPRDVQPEVVADYLAVRQIPTNLAGWEVGLPMSRDELLAKVLTYAAAQTVEHRRHVALELRDAPPWLAEHEAVKAALAALRRDADPRVAAGAAWSTP